MKFLEPTRKPKVIYTDNSLEFGKSCEEFSWNHCTSTPHRSETNGIAERAVRRVKEGTSAVLLQSGLDAKWSADSLQCHCYLRNIQDLLSDGKTPYERRFGMPFNGPVIQFGAVVEYHPISAKDRSRLHQFGAKVLPGIFLGYVLYAAGIWKGDIMVADIEELEEMDASELHARRLNAKEVLTPQRSGNFIFPVADGTVKIFGWGQRLRTSTLTRDRPERGEEQAIFKANQTNYILQLHFKKTQRGMMRKLTMTSGLLQENSCIVITWNLESYCTCRKKNISFSDEVHRRYQNNIYLTGREKNWRLLERGWRKRMVRCMDRLHKIHFIERKATWRMYMVRGETYKETNHLKTIQCMARYVVAYVWCSDKESKTKMCYQDSKARQC